MNPEINPMRRKSAHVIRGERGQTLLMFVLFIVVLIVFVGLGVDLGFAYITRARLSKAVDSACLTGMRNLFQGQPQATIIANSAFFANYGTSGRDVAAPTVNITFGTSNNNVVVDVNATVSINTYFIRVLPFDKWKTLTVGSSAEALRPEVIMSLVLDRSGSMLDNGGSAALPQDVPGFISNFDDAHDIAAMVSFASCASVDVAMEQPFKTQIDNATSALVFNGCCVTTCSDQGLTNALAQNNTVTVPAGEEAIKIIVFFTDGMANTFNYTFDCGSRDIDYNKNLYNPAICTNANTGCSIPAMLSSINPSTGTITANAVDTTSCDAMHFEAENRAERIAWLARSQTNIIYCVGLGDPTKPGECNGDFPVLNPVFLKELANTADSATFDPSQPMGDFAIAANVGELQQAFDTIASKILLRLSR
jgi:Flp pilus assembly protein TadG